METMKNISIAMILSGIMCLSCANSAKNVDDGSFDKSKLDSYFDAIQSRFMGTVLVTRNGKSIYQKSVNYADVENNISTNVGSRYRIGSISKTFTAVMVLKAVDEGKISLSDCLDKYFPNESIANSETITIDNLLYHRSGIHDVFDGVGDYLEWYTLPQTREQLIDMIVKAGSDFEPGSKMQYCNSGYILLTFILEQVYGEKYADLLRAKIAEPLGLNDTYYAVPINTANGECKSYTFENGWKLMPETDPSVPQGAGAIVSTVADLAKFANALFGGYFGQDILAQMSQLNDGFGRGLFQFIFYEYSGLGHTGGIDGFNSVLCHIGDDVVVSLCSNGTTLNPNDILIAVLSAVYGKEYDIPDLNYVTLSASELQKYEGVYSCESLKLDLTITTDGKSMFGQATGQSMFPLDAKADGTFECSKAGLLIQFDLDNSNLILNQGGGKFTFLKK